MVVTDRLDDPAGTVRLGQLMSHLYFVPDGQAARSCEPLDFAWLPSLHKAADHVCADHFFRSPAVAVLGAGYFAALVPDLDLFARRRTIAHALDLRTTDTRIEAPRLSYGICPASLDGHVYFRHDADQVAPVTDGELIYGFDLFFGPAEDAAQVTRLLTRLPVADLWASLLSGCAAPGIAFRGVRALLHLRS